MKYENEPGFFELTPFEKWFLHELAKTTKQFRKRFLINQVLN